MWYDIKISLRELHSSYVSASASVAGLGGIK